VWATVSLYHNVRSTDCSSTMCRPQQSRSAPPPMCRPQQSRSAPPPMSRPQQSRSAPPPTPQFVPEGLGFPSQPSCCRLLVFLLSTCTYSSQCLTVTTASFQYLTAWSRVLPEKLTVPQLVNKFPTFYGTRRFITAFTTARHLSLSWATCTVSTPSYAIYLNPT
jgi:hypothetical protein